MKFGSDDKVWWWMLTKPQARSYIWFLEIERIRHRLDIWLCYILMLFALREFWQSAIRRHKKDIIEIDHLVEMVKHWHKLS